MQVTEQIYVGGKWVASTSENTVVVISPSTEEPVAQVPDASGDDIDAAVGAARTAFDHGPWPRLRPAERADVMQALLAELTTRADEMARVIATENGTPLMMARPAQVDNGLHVLATTPSSRRTSNPSPAGSGSTPPPSSDSNQSALWPPSCRGMCRSSWPC
jgi:acyl-CoA reductase-like NAD-dependent aldehyde dehydrogenase